MAELVGSEVAAQPVELMGCVPEGMTIARKPVPVMQRVPVGRKRGRGCEAEGREVYAAMALPAVPRGSPVEDEDGVVDWFEGLGWGGEKDEGEGENSGVVVLEVESRASVVEPEGACMVGERSFLTLSPGTPGTALLSPVFPASPRLASYYGARASFASSVGDAFRFDEEEEGLSDVDEDEELDVDEMYGFDGEEEVANSLEMEIEMMLGGYVSGASDDWRDGIYSAGSSSPEAEEMGEWGDGEGEEIVVGLDIGFDEVEGEWMRSGIDRPKTRYLAGRNSMLDGDAIFCLRGVDSI